MKLFIVILELFLIGSLFAAETSPQYSRIQIFVPDPDAMHRILNTGIDPEGATGKPGGMMEFIASAFDLELLSKAGITYTTIVADVEKENQKRLVQGSFNALGFGYGSMGGYYTFSEVGNQLDSMAAQYPLLITAKETLALTAQGRPLWVVKISGNPGIDDSTKPEVLYTALHHAREPEGMMAVVYYMWWLLQNYNVDPEATYLINHRQMWFIPVFNPDGYAYNQSMKPDGGGMWRKNRRPNSDGSYGVDLNRNYGNYDMWNAPNAGSSETPNSDTYRGIGPFSENETNAIHVFASTHHLMTALNYHTYGNYLVYPFGCYSRETNDSLIFREFAFDMTGFNRYKMGTDMQTVYYTTRGGSDDYLYGDTTKPRTFAMTPEIGYTGFWPGSTLILPLAVENLRPNMYLAHIAGQYTVTSRFDVEDDGHDGSITKGEAFSLTLTMQNKGLGAAHGLSISVKSDPGLITWTVPAESLAHLGPRSEGVVTLSGSISGSLPNPSRANFYITVADSDGYLHHDTVWTILGRKITLLSDSGNTIKAFWNTGAAWGTTSYAHSGSTAYTDSPAGFSLPNTDNSLTLKSPIDLYGFSHAALEFWTYWAIEPTFDFGIVEVSTDAGSSWRPLKLELSRAGSTYGKQAAGSWGYDGYPPGLTWIKQSADLSPYAGSTVLLRFRMSTDGSDERDGWYLDDVTVWGYTDSPNLSVFNVPVHARWNMVSLPVTGFNDSVRANFPTAISSAFFFDSIAGYLPVQRFHNGLGYWVNVSTEDVIPISGTPLVADTIALHSGWNMIGSIGAVVPASPLQTDPAGIVASQVFSYQTSYVACDSIRPGFGYWLKVRQSGMLYLNSISVIDRK